MNELIDTERHYDYKFVKKNKILDKENDEMWLEYIYKFSTDKNIYFVRISHPKGREDFFTTDFVEKDSYKDEKEINFGLKYNDLNQHDSMKVISTVFRIIKEYYESNIDTLEYFGFSATEKRHRIYKYVISKLFPKWKLRSDKKDGEEWIVHYDLNPKTEDGKVNEELSNSNLIGLAIYFMMMFKYDVKDPNLDINYFNKYVQTIQTAENNPLVREVLKDLKYKISVDSTISNKKEICDKLDSTPIIYRKNDYVCNKLLQMTGKKAEAWTVSLKDKSFVFIDKDSDYNDIYHEFNHVVEKLVKVDPNIVKLFNFNYTFDQQNLLYTKMTNNEYYMTRGMSQDHIEYLNTPGEIYSRLNNFKMFLYKHKYLKSPVGEITEDILTMLFRGQIYAGLDEKEKDFFRTSADFTELLLFIDLKNYKRTTHFVTTENKIIKYYG
jgi:hypothetical protein